MELTVTERFITFVLAIIFAFSLSITPALAEGHDDHDHDDDMHMHDEADKIEQMEMIITLLTQLVALLTEQAGHSDMHDHDSHDHDGHHDDDHDSLEILVELHSDRTHVHVTEPGEDMDTFFVDPEYTDEAAVIAAIAEETGLSEEEIEEVIVFPSGEVDEHGDSVHDHDEHEHHDDEEEDDHEDDMNLDGIHIMGDGSVMLGNGEVLEDATITDDGMIMLENGDLVEPEFDLR